jgi:D-serine deaminase-like pyridoxal phosphate-dependent protein
MTPMTLVDGNDRVETRLAQERDVAQRRLTELAAAIREHEQTLRARPLALRAPDDHLYRRLRQICGG